MEEIKHKVHALAHKSEACLHTAQGRHRTHGYSMISEQAHIEHELARKGEPGLAKMLDRTMGKCVACIKMTAATGRTGFCIVHDLEHIHGEVEKRKSRPSAEWKEIRAADMPQEKRKRK